MHRTPPNSGLTEGATGQLTASLNPTKRQRRNSSPSSPNDWDTERGGHNEMMSILTQVLSEVTELRKANTEMQKSLDFYMKKHDDLCGRLVSLENDKQERDLKIKNLENRLEEFERHTRSTCLEIRGIPAKQKETKQDLHTIVERMHNKLRTEVQPLAIKDIYRLKGKQNGERPLIIEYATSTLKSNTLLAVKQYNRSNITDKLNTSALGIDGQKASVYVSEFLTPKAKRLFYLARDIAKTSRYDFCWTANGRVFLRKSEGKPPILITNEQQLEDLKQKN